MSLRYHIDNTTCECDSPHPIGACLRCDLVAAQAVFDRALGTLKEITKLAGMSRRGMSSRFVEVKISDDDLMRFEALISELEEVK